MSAVRNLYHVNYYHNISYRESDEILYPCEPPYLSDIREAEAFKRYLFVSVTKEFHAVYLESVPLLNNSNDFDQSSTNKVLS